MKKFNIVLALFLVAQSTNTYSMNALRRAASRAANRLAPKAQSLAKSLLEKSKNTLENNTKRAKRFYNTAENTLFKKVESVQSLPKQNQHSTAKKNFSIKPIINSKEKTNIKNIGLAGALSASGAYLLLDKNNVSCGPDFSNFSFYDLCNYLKQHPDSLEEIFTYLDTWNYKEFLETFPEHKEHLFKLTSDNFSKYKSFEIKYLTQAFPNHHDQLFKLASDNFSKYESFEIATIAEIFPDYQNQLFQLISNNFGKYKAHDIKYLTQAFPNHHEQLFKLASDNFSKYESFEVKTIVETFPHHKEKLLQLISDNFGKYKTQNIKYLTQAFPNHHDQLFKLASDNFSKYESFEVKTIVETFPHHKEKLLQLISDNFGKYKAHDIKYLTQAFPNHHDQLFKLTSDNFSKYESFEIKTILETFPHHKEQLLQLISDNFGKYKAHDIQDLTKAFPNHHDQLFKLVSDNFSKYESFQIKYLTQVFPNHHDQLFKLTSDNFSKYESFEIKTIVETFPHHKKELFEIVKNKFTSIFPSISHSSEVKKLIKIFPEHSQELYNIIISQTDRLDYRIGAIIALFPDKYNEIINTVLQNSIWQICPDEIANIKKIIQEMLKVLSVNNQVLSSKNSDLMNSIIPPTQNKQFKSALEKKVLLESQKYTSFFHGQQSQFGFLQDFTKELFNALALQGLIDEPLREDFLYVQNHTELLTKNSQTTLQNARSEQIEMIQDRPSSETKRRPNRLSANLLLTGNSTNSGSCTWSYVLSNSNINKYTPDILENIFIPFNLPQKIMDKYKNRFSELLKKHEQLFTKGRLLLIAIPEKDIDQYTYLATSGACKTKVHRATKLLIFKFYIKKVSEYLNIVKQHPDQLSVDSLDRGSEVAIPLTQASALNPYSDIKIFAFDSEPTDQAEYEQYLKERKQLAEDIAKDVAELNKQTHEFDGLEVCCKEITEAAKTAQSFY